MKNTDNFDSVWWDNFLSNSKQMTETTVIKDCMPKQETALMQKYILDILADIAKLRTNKFGYRVYIDGVQLENNEMIQIYDSPPKENETLEEWTIRTFGNKKFGMIINQGERFNLPLSKMIAFKLKPLLDKIGMPTEGMIFTLFIGNYDKTPLGIHLDLPGKSVIHFHLGPGSKTMYTWDTKEYLDLVGEEKYNNQNIEKYLPYANEHPFDEGDVYFMPEDTYHVGTQEGLSVAIACWCYNRANIDFAVRLQSLLSEQYLSKKDENLKADKNHVDDVSAVNKTLDLFELPKEFEDLSFKNLLKEVYKDLRYSLYSNAGYRTSPFLKKEVISFEMDDTIELEKPYKILYKESLNKEKLQLFIRGIKFEINNFDSIKEFIDEINKGISIKVKDILSFLNKDWDSEIGLYILSILYKHNGINVTKN
ncbi:hypothetical protein [Flavobacterium psychrophilum]|uniref:hypothetical protein n=1 Tax=Flavobacterium psychrophilum TaxID=96345 RepID=UPI001C8F4866|nr:hypothetical protein [Flavobacterium psychrophilum]QZK98520.1 hypothetical protein K5L05_02215 [Flavobacterium psychrophilum]